MMQPRDRLLALVKGGSVTLTLTALAVRLDCTRATAWRTAQALKKAKLITIKGTRGRPLTYSAPQLALPLDG